MWRLGWVKGACLSRPELVLFYWQLAGSQKTNVGRIHRERLLILLWFKGEVGAVLIKIAFEYQLLPT